MAEATQITVVRPLPHRKLHPNGPKKPAGHVRRLKNEYKEDTHVATLGVLGSGQFDSGVQYNIHLGYHLTPRSASHHPDKDGLVSWMKAGLDGFAAGIQVNDKMFNTPTISVAVDKENPRVEITATRVKT